MLRPCLFRSIALTVCALSISLTVGAQVRSSTIVGRVVDPTGAAAPAAEVVIRDTGTNYSYPLTTNEAGEFIQPYLPFGNYEVIVKKAGFKSQTRTGSNCPRRKRCVWTSRSKLVRWKPASASWRMRRNCKRIRPAWSTPWTSG